MRVLVLGAGFGGLELTARLSEEFDGAVDITLIDQSDAFVFGFSKLDVMFGRAVPEEVRHPYSDLVKPGVQFVQAKVQAIDPVAECVRTDAGAAIFAVFLFLTYYLQQDRGYTPIRTGVAFLPMSAAVMLSAVIATNKLRPRTGPRPLAVAGMLLGAGGMLYLTRLTAASSYASGILPTLIMLGVGLGLVSPPRSTAPRSASSQQTPASRPRPCQPPSRSAGRSVPRCSRRSRPAR
jgi:MFS transporter